MNRIEEAGSHLSVAGGANILVKSSSSLQAYQPALALIPPTKSTTAVRTLHVSMARYMAESVAR